MKNDEKKTSEENTDRNCGSFVETDDETTALMIELMIEFNNQGIPIHDKVWP